MGCGTSQDKILQDQTHQSFPPKVAVLYAETRSSKFTDLSGNFPEDIPIMHTQEGVWSYDIDSWRTLNDIASKCDQVVFIVDLVSVEFFYLDQQIVMLTEDAEKNRINENKFMFIFLIPTAGSPQGFTGPAGWCYKSAFCTLVQHPTDPTCFLERSTWYKSSNAVRKLIAMQCIQRLIQLQKDPTVDKEAKHCFYPHGVETFNQIKTLYHNLIENIWTRRKFVFHIVLQSHPEQIIESCLELFDSQVISKEYDNQLQTQGFSLVKYSQDTPVLSFPVHEKHIMGWGPVATKYMKSMKGTFTEYSKILETDVEGLRNFVYVVDVDIDKRAVEELTKAQFLDKYLDDTHTMIIILPADKKKWPLLLPIMQVAIESCQVVIFLNEDEPKNEQFLQLITQSECSFSEISLHLCPYPRLHFYIPTFKQESIVKIPGELKYIDLTRDSNIGGGLSFGSSDYEVRDPKTLSRNQYLQNFLRVPGTSNAESGFGLIHSSQVSLIAERIGAMEDDSTAEVNEKYWGFAADWKEYANNLTELYKDYYYAFYNYDQDDDQLQFEQQAVPVDDTQE